MKKVKYVLLAILSVFIFAFASCKDEVASSTPQSSSPTKQFSSSSSENEEENPTETPQTPVEKTFFQATYCDVEFQSTILSNRSILLIEATPKYHIHNLEIMTKLLFLSVSMETDYKLIEEAPAHQKISWIVELPQRFLDAGYLIETYYYDVVGGEYDATTQIVEASFSSAVLNNSTDSLSANFTLATDEKSFLIDFLPTINLYDLEIMIHCLSFRLPHQNNYYAWWEENRFEKIVIASAPANKLSSIRIFPADSLLTQDATVYGVEILIKACYRIEPEENSNPTKEYWAQFSEV